MPGQALPGFREFYPEETALRSHIFKVWRDVAARYSFDEYDGPPLEPLELYTAKSGEEIVDQLYAFHDKAGRAVALRPEMTPTLARMVAARAQALKKPIRWFSIPQLFRYERQQRGRLREHFQLNMDLIGEPGPLADAEIIAAAIDVQRGLGFGPDDVRVRIADRRVVYALLVHAGVADDAMGTTYTVLDKFEREPRKKLHDRLTAAGLESAVADRALAVGAIRDRATLSTALGELAAGPDVGDDLFACMDALDAMGLGEFADIDLSIVRGLAYYTGIVFEVFDARRSLRAICGGGRYDGLLKALGGVDLPATGFGMGDVVLSELVRARATRDHTGPRLDTFLIAVTAEDVAPVLELGHAMRDAGRSVEFALKAQSMSKQLKLAAARGARRAVIVGPDERAAGAAIVRDLDAGTEERVAFERLKQ